MQLAIPHGGLPIAIAEERPLTGKGFRCTDCTTGALNRAFPQQNDNCNNVVMSRSGCSGKRLRSLTSMLPQPLRPRAHTLCAPVMILNVDSACARFRSTQRIVSFGEVGPVIAQPLMLAKYMCAIVRGRPSEYPRGRSSTVSPITPVLHWCRYRLAN